MLACFRSRVVTQIGGDVGVGAAGAHIVEHAVAGASTDGDRAHGSLRVARDPYAGRRPRQRGGHALRELAQRLGRRQVPDTPETTVAG